MSGVELASLDRLKWQCLNVLAGAKIKRANKEYYHPIDTYRSWLERLEGDSKSFWSFLKAGARD